jgi:molybdopterin adenylyltransferase
MKKKDNIQEDNICADTTAKHKEIAPEKVTFAIVTVSTTRSINEDVSGNTIKEIIEKAKHSVVEHIVVKDDIKEIKKTITRNIEDKRVNAIVVNGGTGISGTDMTIEAIKEMFDKELTSFGVIFAQLSYNEIGSAAIMSRATAGIIKRKVVFCIPGSPRACRLAMEKLIIPEAGHIIKHLQEE